VHYRKTGINNVFYVSYFFDTINAKHQYIRNGKVLQVEYCGKNEKKKLFSAGGKMHPQVSRCF
jgi:hypothetical protein